MQISRCSHIDQWESLAPTWNSLTRGNPFASWSWLSTWWRYYGKGRELFVLAVRDGNGSLIGAAPWFIERCATKGRLIRVLGSDEVCSEYVSVLCRPEHEETVAEAVANYLTNGERQDPSTPGWDLLLLDSVPAGDTVIAQLVANLAEANCSLVQRPSANCWSIDLPETWEAYLGSLSKSHRKQISRAFRDYVVSERAQLTFIDDMGKLPVGMDLLIDLHCRRWKSLGREGNLSRERFAGFLRDVAPLLLRANSLQLSLLMIEGKCAAVDFHLLTSEANYAYQGGIEPEMADHSPGGMLIALLIRDAIERGRRRFDFLRGDEPYKQHFRATPTPTHDFYVVPRALGPQIRHGVWLAGNMMRSLVRSGMTLTGLHAAD